MKLLPSRIRAAMVLCLLLSCCAPSRGTIGAILSQRDDGRVFVRETPPGLAARQAGLMPDDEILFINGVSVRELNARELHLRLSGEVDEPVDLTVARGDSVYRVTLRRTPAPSS